MTDDVYSAVEELITELRTAGNERLAAILHHRVHQVAWTTQSELLEELDEVLRKAVESDDTFLPQQLREKIERVLRRVGDLQ